VSEWREDSSDIPIQQLSIRLADWGMPGWGIGDGRDGLG
jgi:hypothetical protein